MDHKETKQVLCDDALETVTGGVGGKLPASKFNEGDIVAYARNPVASGPARVDGKRYCGNEWQYRVVLSNGQAMAWIPEYMLTAYEG